MSRGVVLIAHNNDKDDYYSMAVYTAKRVNKFLNLPVTVITSQDSVNGDPYVFDKTIYVDPDKTNYRKKSTWINKGRYGVWSLSPYDDTLLLDTDYLINSRQLLESFNSNSDFLCHKNIRWLMEGETPEYISRKNISTLWATVVRFKKTNRAEQIFGMMQMVQENYGHYANIYGFNPGMYRNDYALTIALKTVNGHIEHREDYFWWRLLHTSLDVEVHRNTETSYTLIAKNKKTQKQEYLVIKDLDFHMLNKKNFLELAQ